MLTRNPRADQRLARDPALALWSIAALSWVGTVWLTVHGGAHAGAHDHVLETSHAAWTIRLVEFLLVWIVMIGAMMVPSVVPMARAFTAVSANQPRPGPARSVFYVSYVAVWTAFAFAALTFDKTVHLLVEHWSWLFWHEEVILGTTLVVAGLFQLSPLKEACLTACRTPLSLVRQHYRRGVAGGWRVGFAHALNCLGCCWALMLVMFATGVGSLVWMAGLTAVMVIEKTVRWGDRLVLPTAGVLILVGFSMTIPTVNS